MEHVDSAVLQQLEQVPHATTSYAEEQFSYSLLQSWERKLLESGALSVPGSGRKEERLEGSTKLSKLDTNDARDVAYAYCDLAC